MNALRLALDAVVAAEHEYNARCLVVWRELKATDPVLAEEILRLGFDEPAAAQRRYSCPVTDGRRLEHEEI